MAEKKERKCGHLTYGGHTFHHKDRVNVTIKGSDFEVALKDAIIAIDSNYAIIYYNEDNVVAYEGKKHATGNWTQCGDVVGYDYHWRIAERSYDDVWHVDIGDFLIEGTLKPVVISVDEIEIF